MIKEHPIIFSPAMVRAILDGTKSQTRRIMKPQPFMQPILARHLAKRGWPEWYTEDSLWRKFCPYGSIGKKLWVRESWRIGAWNEDDEQIAVDYIADGYCRKEWLDVPLDERDMFNRFWIQSSDDAAKSSIKPDGEGKYHWEPGQSPCRTRPSIHMPRWASRILLEITNIRIERLQSISSSDAEAEGIEHLCGMWRDYHSVQHAQIKAVDSYRTLWESINGKGSWDINPFVWCISFRRIDRNITC